MYTTKVGHVEDSEGGIKKLEHGFDGVIEINKPPPAISLPHPIQDSSNFQRIIGTRIQVLFGSFFFVPILYESCFCCTSIGCDAAFVLKFAIAFVLIHQSRKGLLQKLCRIVSPYLHSAIPIHRNVQINILKAILFSFAKSVFFQNI